MNTWFNARTMLIALAMLSPSCFGNDSTGYAGVGGLILKKTADIEMSSEHLFISKDKIRVDYEFTNLTDHDVSETILFPLPIIKPKTDGDFAHTEGTVQSFKVWVNNQATTTQAHSSGFWQDQDITSALKKCGFSPEEIGFAYYISPYSSALEISAEKIRACIASFAPKTKALSNEDAPLWDSQVTYSWHQVFPAHKTIHVRHEYVPLAGGATNLGLNFSNVNTKTFCLDSTFMSKLKKGGSKDAAYTALSYVLKTGANWAKPIPKFTLTIDKSVDELLSLCWDASLKKTSPTRFEAIKTNFTPTRNIDVIFATPYSY